MNHQSAMNPAKNRARMPLVRRTVVEAVTVLMIGTSMLPSLVHAQPIDPCNVITQSAQRGQMREVTQISTGAAATKEALDASLNCLENVLRALNALIPGVSVNLNIAGIISGLINRACQVVTTRIDAAGNVIQGTISGATNRVIGDINSTVGVPITSGGSGGNTTGVTTGAGGLSGGVSVAPTPVAPPPAAAGSFLCRLRGTC